jgi:hypothetical protein
VEYIILPTYLPTYLQSFVGAWPLFQFLNLYTVSRTTWTEIGPSQGRYLHTEQHKHRINANRYPCFEWDSNPRSQRSSERDSSYLRPRGHCDRRSALRTTFKSALQIVFSSSDSAASMSWQVSTSLPELLRPYSLRRAAS